MLEEIRVPEIGENIESGDVTAVLIEVGQSVEPEQGLLELETDKAVVEMPSPSAGRVAEILVAKGQTVRIGQLVLKIERDDDVEGEGEQAPQQATSTAPARPSAAPAGPSAPEPAQASRPATGPATPTAGVSAPAPAAPSTRRFAREIGVEISEVRGSGPNGRISVDDIKEHSRRRRTLHGGSPALPARPLPDFTRWGAVQREALSKVRRITAETMAHAAATIPQVTQFEKADITALEDFRERYGSAVEARGAKLTPTVILLKVVALALRRFQRFNASIDLEQGELILKDYVNISIAMDTPRGLIVPVLFDADRKNLAQLAAELGELVARTRAGKVKPAELEGGTFSLSNQGPLGGDNFTPIVYPPQAAILGVSQAATEPAWIDGRVEPRRRLPLALSYDHRINDGADAARFLHWICGALEHPMALFL